MEWYWYMGIFVGTFIVVRFFIIPSLIRRAARRQYRQEYIDVLTQPRYRVKGNYEE